LLSDTEDDQSFCQEFLRNNKYLAPELLLVLPSLAGGSAHVAIVNFALQN
jgi:hypothetical protein